MNKPYDQRQLRLMQHFIVAYDGSLNSLGRLIQRLEALAECLQDAGSEWLASFRAEWWTLEQVYAVALDRNATKLDDEGTKFVDDALTTLKQMVEAEIIPEDELEDDTEL